MYLHIYVLFTLIILFEIFSKVSPRGNAVSVGGADGSVALAQVTTEWPDPWYSPYSGTYAANVTVDIASLSGAGIWKVFIMNAWSLSERVEYDIIVRLKFQGLPPSKTGGSCGPTMSPTPFETAVPTISMGPTASPTPGDFVISHLLISF